MWRRRAEAAEAERDEQRRRAEAAERCHDFAYAVGKESARRAETAEAERDMWQRRAEDGLDAAQKAAARAEAAEARVVAWLPVMQAAWNLYAKALNASREQYTEDLLLALMMLPREQQP